MSIDTSNFAVERDGQLYRVLGSELADKLQAGDLLVVQRGDTQYKYTVADPIVADDILDDDLFACTDTDDVTYKVTGEVMKTLIKTTDPVECVPDEQAYREALQWIRTEYSRCKLLCETAYCQSICDKQDENYKWWAETLYKCADPDRPKPPGYTETNPLP